MALTAPADVQIEPGRRRLYRVSSDLLRNPSDYQILNEQEFYPLTRSAQTGEEHLTFAGARRFRLPDRAHDITFGLPALRAKPKVFVAMKNKPLDIYGFLTRRVVSTRAKNLLDELDPEAFDAVECETVTRRGVSVEPYWLIDIARLVDRFDEERSVFELAKGEDILTGEPYEGPHIANLYDIHLPANFPAEHRAFVFAKHLNHIIFDGVLVDAWRAHKFTGAEFEPLQHPTPAECKARPPHVPYWWSKYKAFHDGRKPDN
jgi:Protein of unknown function (DUF1629)